MIFFKKLMQNADQLSSFHIQTISDFWQQLVANLLTSLRLDLSTKWDEEVPKHLVDKHISIPRRSKLQQKCVTNAWFVSWKVW